MRPTDENQDGSTRPNLLSGGQRRSADDDNILARLERDSVRHALGNRSRAAWHVAAAALVLLLVLFVAWMAYQNTAPTRVIPMPPAPADMGPAGASVDSSPRWSLPPSTSAPQHISDTAAHMVPLAPLAPLAPLPTPDAVHDHDTTHLPPLVLLERVSPSAKTGVAPPVVRSAPVPNGRNATSTPGVAVTGPQLSHALAPAAVTVTRSARANVTPRPRKLAVDDAAADAPVDSDVALLSAIIIHDSTHATEKAQLDAAAACARTAERRCARKTSANP